MYLGDFKEDGDIFFKFTTRAFATGIPTTLAGSPVLSVYKDEGGAATEKTTTEAYFDLDVDHDSIAGWNNVRIDLSGDAFFATGADYSVVITTGTVDSVNVFGENLANFSIENRSMGQPAGATLADDIAAIKSDSGAIKTETDKLTFTVANQLDTNPLSWSGGTIPTQSVTGVPEVDVTHHSSGIAPTPATTGVPDVNTVEFLDVAVAAATASGEVNANVTELGGVVQSLTDLKDFADAGYDPGSNKITGCVLTDTVTTVTNQLSAAIVANQVWDTDATGRQTAGTFGQAIGDPGANAETIYDAVVTDAAGTNIAADIIVVDGNVDDIKAATIMASGVVETSGSNSSTQVQTDLAEATNDHYDVMTIAFTSGAEAGQSRLITGYVGATGTVSWNAALTGTPADDVTFVILAAGTTADAVWDEILTGSSHNIATSAGKRLRQLEQAFTLASGTVAAVSGHKITLDAGAVATTDFYISARLQITEGNGAGQSRVIVAYSSGKVATLDSEFVTAPNTASLYEVIAADVHVSVSDSDLAEGFVNTATSTTTITLDDGAVATTDYYKDMTIVFTKGPGAGQSREIEAYTSGRVVTMSPALVTAVTTATTWHIQTSVSASHIVNEVLTTQMAESYAADGTAPTLAQALFGVLQQAGEFAISGTTITVKKLDGSTTAMTFTLDDDTNPTSRTRAT